MHACWDVRFFETEILIKWLLERDTDERLAEYLSEVDEEKARVARKIKAGRSVAAQIMRDVLPACRIFHSK
jgi:hypothetical protein